MKTPKFNWIIIFFFLPFFKYILFLEKHYITLQYLFCFYWFGWVICVWTFPLVSSRDTVEKSEFLAIVDAWHNECQFTCHVTTADIVTGQPNCSILFKPKIDTTEARLSNNLTNTRCHSQLLFIGQPIELKGKRVLQNKSPPLNILTTY